MKIVFPMLLLLCACTAPSGATSAGVVASLTVGQPNLRPDPLVRYNANVFVGWGSREYIAEIFIEATGLPLYLELGAANVAVVRVRKPELLWKGKVGDALPAAARPLFRQAEVDAWGLTFEPSEGP